LTLTLGWCGCFRGLDAIRGEAATRPSIQLEIRDLHAAVWQAEQAPRWPTFVLQFADGPPEQVDHHLFLLRGSASDEIAADLGSAQLRAATEAKRVPLTREAVAGALWVRPTHPLEPGAAYTLVWAEAGESQRFPLLVSQSPAAGARLAHSLPAAQERQVPPNLAHALLRFDGYVLGDLPRCVSLLDAADEAVPIALRRMDCAELGLAAGDCVYVTPESELAPAARYRLLLQAGLEDATGAPLAAQEVAFDTASEGDTRAPVWLGLDCARDELAQGPACTLVGDSSVAIRARADENGVLSLAIGAELRASLGSSGDHALEAPLERPLAALLQLRDLAGNTAQLPLELAPARDLPKVSIDEVRVDPLGPEPSQEYVELLNFGETSMSIAGFSLSDDAFAAGRRIQGPLTLAAGERILLVPADFDAGDAHDDVPAAGVRLARLAGALPLRNDGSALFLRDAGGRRVSASPAIAPEQAGQCIARTSADARSGKSAAFALDPDGRCTPGYATQRPFAGRPPQPTP
jgi:hypothetical protein